MTAPRESVVMRQVNWGEEASYDITTWAGLDTLVFCFVVVVGFLFVSLFYSSLIYSMLLPLLTPMPTPPEPLSIPFLFRKGQASHGYQPKMAYQVAVLLGTSPHIKAAQGNPIGLMGSQKQAKETEIPAPTLRSHRRRSRYTTVTNMQDLGQTNAGSLVDSSVSESRCFVFVLL